jgi:hypothetical protein
VSRAIKTATRETTGLLCFVAFALRRTDCKMTLRGDREVVRYDILRRKASDARCVDLGILEINQGKEKSQMTLKEGQRYHGPSCGDIIWSAIETLLAPLLALHWRSRLPTTFQRTPSSKQNSHRPSPCRPGFGSGASNVPRWTVRPGGSRSTTQQPENLLTCEDSRHHATL